MAGARVELRTVDPLQAVDRLQRILRERGLALESVQHDALEQDAEPDLPVPGQRLSTTSRRILRRAPVWTGSTAMGVSESGSGMKIAFFA